MEHVYLKDEFNKILISPLFKGIQDNEKFFGEKLFKNLRSAFKRYLNKPDNLSFSQARESFNELLAVDALFKKFPNAESISYETPPTKIDFQLVQNGKLFQIEVKSVYPDFNQENVNKTKYSKALSENIFPPNHSVQFDDPHGGEEIMHGITAARKAMIRYISDFEQKLSLSTIAPDSATLLFVGNGLDWNLTRLEDIAYFYRTRQTHVTDSFGYQLNNSQPFQNTIQQFSFLKCSNFSSNPQTELFWNINLK